MRKILSLGGPVLGLFALAALAWGQSGVSAPPGKAAIVVKVPENAEIMINGQATVQRGGERTFITQELAPGFKYGFEFTVIWKEGAADKKASKTVIVRAGDTSLLDFSKSDSVVKVDPKKEVVVPKGDPKVRKFYFTYGATIKDLKPGAEASIWLPVPSATPEQEVSIFSKKMPAEATMHQEKLYGNRMLFLKAKADDQGEIPLQVTYAVQRREVRTDRQGNLYVKSHPGEPIDRFLQADKLVPTSGKPLELLKGTKLSGDQFASAKMMYDLVNEHMKYSKEGKGWGRGDSVWACDSKFGNCTDFHSLFISMARGNKIASKFEMGFPVPPKRGEGPIGGYHCWAWFLPDGKGWIPVDISEANRFPEMREYYFGNLTEDRVQFSTGRDIDLEPRQKGAALNFFIYPYVEVDGAMYPQEKITRTFAYQDVK